MRISTYHVKKTFAAVGTGGATVLMILEIAMKADPLLQMYAWVFHTISFRYV